MDFTSPAELPAEVTALKSQQFRWTKGAIETARKILPQLWKSDFPLRVKIHSTFHLTNNIVFPFILLAGILNVPLVYIKQKGLHDEYFLFMSVFVLAFVGSFLLYLLSQRAVYGDWRRRILLFPLFMAGSMGFAVNNSRAVFEALFINDEANLYVPPNTALSKRKIRGAQNRNTHRLNLIGLSSQRSCSRFTACLGSYRPSISWRSNQSRFAEKLAAVH